MQDTNIHSLPSEETESPIKDGDAALILRRDGTVVPMVVGAQDEEIDRLREKDPAAMTEEELDTVIQGQNLYLLAMAANNEAIMQFLAKLASMPGETTLDSMRGAITNH